jgi:hypothetical protein
MLCNLMCVPMLHPCDLLPPQSVNRNAGSTPNNQYWLLITTTTWHYKKSPQKRLYVQARNKRYVVLGYTQERKRRRARSYYSDIKRSEFEEIYLRKAVTELSVT